jgi:hypothetical protein
MINHNSIGSFLVVNNLMLWLEWIKEGEIAVLSQDIDLDLIAIDFAGPSLTISHIFLMNMMLDILDVLFDQFDVTIGVVNLFLFWLWSNLFG